MKCPKIPTVSLSRLAHRLNDRMAGSRFPVTGSMEVTARCNLSCAHCYINLPLADGSARTRELTCHEFCGILDQIADAGCLWLLLTGGEPLIRPDFLEIYTYGKKKGLLITLFTNGTTLTPRIADYLAEWKPLSVEISLYGSTQATYEAVTGVPGSYGRCIKGIELLLERKMPLRLKSPVMATNVSEVWEMKALAGKLGLEFRFDPVLNMRMDGSCRPAAYRISPEDVVSLDLADEERMEEFRKFCGMFWGPPPDPGSVYQCGAGRNTFHIDPYGHLSACLMSRAGGFDLRRGTFHEGWNDFIPAVISQGWSKDVPCKSCQLYPLCGQCPASAQLEYGDAERPVEYLCRIAHLRAEAFGLNNTTGREMHG